MRSVLLPHRLRKRVESIHSRFFLSSHRRIVDLRSDTVTSPSPALLEAARTAPTGDDVLGEDPTVRALECYMAERCGKECGLFLPTATMANLVAVMAHCDRRGAEILMGAHSHMALWEAGNSAGIAGVFAKQLLEDETTAQLSEQQIRKATVRDDTDDHRCHTQLLCLENTHNMLGGVALPLEYMQQMDALCHKEDQLRLRIHLDGARICNAAVALGGSLAALCQGADTVTLCLSKGLGAPLGSVLVGEQETIRLARRARKRCGGGMRQAGVVAAMGLYAMQHNYDRLIQDHERAQFLASVLLNNGFSLMRNGKVDTNIIYFQLPETTTTQLNPADFCARLEKEFGVKVTGGYSSTRGGDYFRAVTHLDVSDEDVQYAADAMVQICFRSS
jgi:threonine aldolase